LTPTKVHAVPLQLTSARLRSSPTLPHVHVRGCGQERLPDLLSVCLQMFLYGSKGIASKMRTILYGRQLAVTWCTSRVDFGAGVNHSPACRARLLLRIGRSDQITRGLNVCSVRGCKGTQISSWMSWLARRSTGTGKGILEACFARGGGSAGQCCMLWAASARWSFVCCDKCAASCASDAIARQFCGASP
jgi:hypothetical protein